MIKLLLSRKAEITRKDHLGRNCLDWAIENNQRYICLAYLFLFNVFYINLYQLLCTVIPRVRYYETLNI